MRPRDRGNIVNVGSALAFLGIPLQSPYCSAKFACRGFFESARAQLLHEGSHVRLSMVHLPAVNTPQFDWCQTTMDRHPQPVPPIYQPEIPAKIHRRGCSGRAPRQGHRLLEQAPGGGAGQMALRGWGTTTPPTGPGTRQLAHLPLRARPTRQPPPPGRRRPRTPGPTGSSTPRREGFFDPSFLKTLPNAGRTFLSAVVANARDRPRRSAASR